MNGQFTEIGYIYTLSCPDTGIIKYVGSTFRPKERTWSHHGISGDNHRLDEWKKRLFTANKNPVIRFVKVCNRIEMHDVEADYYQLYKSLDLLNLNVLERRLTGAEIDETIGIAKQKALKQVQISIGIPLHPTIVSEFFRKANSYMSGEKERKIRDFVLTF